MNLKLDSPLVALVPGQVISLDDAAGTRIRARYGAIWITYEDDPVDVILRPGEATVVHRGGRTVVQALEPAWVALQ
jgi:hypothetical protein